MIGVFGVIGLNRSLCGVCVEFCVQSVELQEPYLRLNSALISAAITFGENLVIAGSPFTGRFAGLGLLRNSLHASFRSPNLGIVAATDTQNASPGTFTLLPLQ